MEGRAGGKVERAEREAAPRVVWSSYYQVGGLLSEPSLNPDFTKVKNLEKNVFEI